MMQPIDFLTNPEYALVVLTSEQGKLFIGNDHQLEFLNGQDFKSQHGCHLRKRQQYQELMNYAHLLHSNPRISSVPLIVVAEARLMSIFLGFFEHPFGTLTHVSDSMGVMTSPELLGQMEQFRAHIREIYLGHFMRRLRTQMKSGRVLTKKQDIIKAVHTGRVARILLTTSAWERIRDEGWSQATDQEEIIVQCAPAKIFPLGIEMLAILKGDGHVLASLPAMEA